MKSDFDLPCPFLDSDDCCSNIKVESLAIVSGNKKLNSAFKDLHMTL